MTTANALTAEILAGISERHLGVAWRSNVVRAMAIGRSGKPRMISAGIEGQGDITGILNDGRRLEIEVKVGRDQQSDRQKAFERVIQKHGGVYVVARDKEECLACIAARLRMKI